MTFFQMTGVAGVRATQLNNFAFRIFSKANGVALVGGVAMVEFARHENYRFPVVEQDDGQRYRD